MRLAKIESLAVVVYPVIQSPTLASALEAFPPSTTTGLVETSDDTQTSLQTLKKTFKYSASIPNVWPEKTRFCFFPFA